MEVNFQQVHKKVLQAVEQQVKSRCVRASNILKQKSDDILSNKGGRSGRIYRKPHTKHATYQASAPGEPPALRTGDLRRSWKPLPYSQMKAGENMFTPGIRTDIKDWLGQQLRRCCERTGVKIIRVHDIRHSHASMLVEQGCDPLLIAERLGHERISTTLGTYSHLYPDKGQTLAATLGALKERADRENAPPPADDPPDPEPDF